MARIIAFPGVTVASTKRRGAQTPSTTNELDRQLILFKRLWTVSPNHVRVLADIATSVLKDGGCAK